MHNGAFKGRMFDQGYDSTRKTSDPLTVNVSMYPTAVIVSRRLREGGLPLELLEYRVKQATEGKEILDTLVTDL